MATSARIIWIASISMVAGFASAQMAEVEAHMTRFPHPKAGQTLTFPRDHGHHPESSFEWWYLTGHLYEGGKKVMGTQLTVFRVAGRGPNSTPQIVVHMGLTDLISGQFQHLSYSLPQSAARISADDLNHSSPGFGMVLQQDRLDLHYGGRTKQGTFQITGRLDVAMPVVRHGNNGLSRKSECPTCVTMYSSLPLLKGLVTLSQPDKPPRQLQASYWYDHEFGSQVLGDMAVGWDWFGIQLQDGSAIMVFQLRNQTGKPIYRSGSLISPEGQLTNLKDQQDKINLTPTKTWRSPHTGATYPIHWRLAIPQRPAIVIKTSLADQEVSTQTLGFPIYYEGTAEVLDESGRKIGDAYMEMNGYGKERMTL